MPSLGYAIPNEREGKLDHLEKVGLGNARAARALRRSRRAAGAANSTKEIQS
jgi:hypothetical protein